MPLLVSGRVMLPQPYGNERAGGVLELIKRTMPAKSECPPERVFNVLDKTLLGLEYPLQLSSIRP
jgi:hypothetical protein